MRRSLVDACYERHVVPQVGRGAGIGALGTVPEFERRILEINVVHDYSANRLGELADEMNAAEARISSRGEGARPLPDPLRVAAAIGERAVLLDFLRYQPLGGEPRYLVFVVRHATAPRRYDLGPAAPINRDIASWRAAIEADSDDRDVAAALYRRLWEPISKLCRGATTVLLAPDGELSQMP